MREIAAHAGVGSATLHRHFRTKSDLIDAIGIQCIDEMNVAVRAHSVKGQLAVDRLRGMFEAVIPLGDRYNFLGTFRTQDSSIEEGYSAQLRWAISLVEELKQQGVVHGDIPTRWIVAQIDQLVWAAWNGIAEGYLKPEEAPELAVRTLLFGLR